MSEDIHKWSDGRYVLMFDEHTFFVFDNENDERMTALEVTKKLNEQQEFIEELQVSDEMGWKRAEHFEKKCPKELHNKKMYIKRLEYKVQKFKEMNGEQQATNDYLEESNSRLQIQLGETLRLVDEQQATIRRLQDLCGESDGENAKLRIENKMLEKEVNLLKPTNIEQYEQIQKLQKENGQLKNKLNKGL